MADEKDQVDCRALAARAISKPLVTHIHTADPSAHVFEGRVYIYPSHDIDAGVAPNDLGDEYRMEDYHVLCMDSPQGDAIDCGLALHLKDIPWADRQLWAPDAAYRDGTYYLYFPAKRADGVFQIGVAAGADPAGPFVAEPEPIEGSYSIDPAAFGDDDGAHYLYFGGLWGGQLQSYRDNAYDAKHVEPAGDQAALGPRVARLHEGMKRFAEAPREVLIVDADGRPLRADDHGRRFFEAPWVHKYRGRYYLSYSTGNTHLLCYATSSDPYGPFVHQGTILTPVVGWTTHHSIVEFEGKWYLYYHDSLLSGGQNHLRTVKVTQLAYDEHGRIVTIHPYGA